MEQRLTQDAALKSALDICLRLNTSLRQLPLEQPSLRFALNVMDRLPGLVKKIKIEPLIPHHWLRAFWASLATVLCGVIALVSGSEPAGMASSSPIAGAVDHWIALFNNLPYDYLFTGATIALGLLTLEAIERRVAKVYGR